MKDYYYILGLKRNATIEEIKKSYRKLSLKFHPDQNNGDEFFVERFKEIKDAYDVLIDSAEKEKYDSLFEKHFNQSKPKSDNKGFNFLPIIENFTSNKSSFEFDETITFSWKTINANKVLIKPLGDVDPIGQKSYKIKDFKNEYIEIVLVAENSIINKTVSSTIILQNKTYKNLYDDLRNKIEREKNSSKVTSTNNDNTNNSKSNALQWILPILLLLGVFVFRKNFENKNEILTESITEVTPVTISTPYEAKVSVDAITNIVKYDLGIEGVLELPNGVNLKNIAEHSFENTLVNFIKTGTIDTVNKAANWFNLHDVQFLNNKTTYSTPKAMQQIKNISEILKAYPKVVLKIGGNTDVSGDAAKNKAISDYRAKQVMKDLIANGAFANQIKEAVGYGSEFAVAPVGDKEAMARDRKTTAKVVAL